MSKERDIPLVEMGAAQAVLVTGMIARDFEYVSEGSLIIAGVLAIDGLRRALRKDTV